MDDVAAVDQGSQEEQDPTLEKASAPFVGQWNQLVSTTNWEKGKIITDWRNALIDTGAPATVYSDEAWTQRVGGVTGQHVGRLRRVYQRFHEVYPTYEGLFWSHFHAALDWEDAEMWLEGAVQNKWSVSQMRTTRWTTMGGTDVMPIDAEIVLGELDEDFEPAQNDAPTAKEAQREIAPDVADFDDTLMPDKDPQDKDEDGASIYAADDPQETVEFVRPFENIAELPEDLADAFEDFKLAILRHKGDDWQQISCDDVLASLDALKELARAPSTDVPF